MAPNVSTEPGRGTAAPDFPSLTGALVLPVPAVRAVRFVRFFWPAYGPALILVSMECSQHRGDSPIFVRTNSSSRCPRKLGQSPLIIHPLPAELMEWESVDSARHKDSPGIDGNVGSMGNV